MNPFHKLRDLVLWVLGDDLSSPKEPEQKQPVKPPPRKPPARGDGFEAPPRARVSLEAPAPEPKREPVITTTDFNASLEDLKDLVDEPVEPRPEFIPEGGMSTESLMREFESLDAETQARAVALAEEKREVLPVPQPPAVSSVTFPEAPRDAKAIAPPWLIPATTAAPRAPRAEVPSSGLSTESLVSEFKSLTPEAPEAPEARRTDELAVPLESSSVPEAPAAARSIAPPWLIPATTAAPPRRAPVASSGMSTELLVSEFESLTPEAKAAAVELERSRALSEASEVAPAVDLQAQERLRGAAERERQSSARSLAPPWLIPATSAAPPSRVAAASSEFSTESLMSEFDALAPETQAAAVELEAQKRAAREEADRARAAREASGSSWEADASNAGNAPRSPELEAQKRAAREEADRARAAREASGSSWEADASNAGNAPRPPELEAQKRAAREEADRARAAREASGSWEADASNAGNAPRSPELEAQRQRLREAVERERQASASAPESLTPLRSAELRAGEAPMHQSPAQLEAAQRGGDVSQSLEARRSPEQRPGQAPLDHTPASLPQSLEAPQNPAQLELAAEQRHAQAPMPARQSPTQRSGEVLEQNPTSAPQSLERETQRPQSAASAGFSTESLMSEFEALTPETQAAAVELEAQKRAAREEADRARAAREAESWEADGTAPSSLEATPEVNAPRRIEAAQPSSSPESPAASLEAPRRAPSPDFPTESLMSEFESLTPETQAAAVEAEAQRRAAAAELEARKRAQLEGTAAAAPALDKKDGGVDGE